MADTSPFVLASPDSTLPNSRVLATTTGLSLQDTGAEGTLTIAPVGNLQNLSEFSSPGFLVYDSGLISFTAREVTGGTGISISAPAGQGANTVVSVVPNSTIQQVQVLNNGLLSSTRSTLNFIPGGSVSITVGDSSDPSQANINITAPITADSNATYILQTPDLSLPNSQPLSPLATGLLKVTTGTGVVSTAVANTDYLTPSVNLTSISAITPNNGSLIVGNGTGYEGFPSGGDPGDVFTSGGFGNLPTWQAPATGNLTEVLPNPTTSVALVGKTTYIARNSSGGRTIFTLPVSPTPGDFYQIIGVATQGWQVNQNASQQIIIGPVATTAGTGGNIQSTLATGPGNDSVIIWCVTATEFVGIPLCGEINVT